MPKIPPSPPMSSGTLYRLSAFTKTPHGGNPAGVWIGDALPDPGEMQRLAAAVGFSETAFVVPARGLVRTVRYYSPEAEVPFCGHATIAAGVQLGRLHGDGDYVFETAAGQVSVAVRHQNGRAEATLTSVPPKHVPTPGPLLSAALQALHWHDDELDPSIPSALAYAGAWHLVIAAATAERLARLAYEYDTLKALMLQSTPPLTTVQLVWRESTSVFHARNPFPVGGVVEDPATGAAAAALGGYLRAARLIEVPADVLIRQGDAMGRPSRLRVRIPIAGGIAVSGHAVELEPR